MADGEFHSAVEAVLEFFENDGHLPAELQRISDDFAELALRTARRAPNDPETTVAIRKLLEAKDAAVRAYVRVLRRGVLLDGLPGL